MWRENAQSIKKPPISIGGVRHYISGNNAKNTLVTPHMAFASKEAMVKRAHIVFENIAQFAQGTPKNVVG